MNNHLQTKKEEQSAYKDFIPPVESTSNDIVDDSNDEVNIEFEKDEEGAEGGSDEDINGKNADKRIATSAEEILQHFYTMSSDVPQVYKYKNYLLRYWLAVIIARNVKKPIRDSAVAAKFHIARNTIKPHMSKDPWKAYTDYD